MKFEIALPFVRLTIAFLFLNEDWRWYFKYPLTLFEFRVSDGNGINPFLGLDIGAGVENRRPIFEVRASFLKWWWMMFPGSDIPF